MHKSVVICLLHLFKLLNVLASDSHKYYTCPHTADITRIFSLYDRLTDDFTDGIDRSLISLPSCQNE